MPDPDFIRRRTTEIALRDGTRVLIRPIVPGDADELLRGFRRLSPTSRYRRFLTDMKTLTPEMVRHLTEVDYVDHFAWVAFAIDEPGEPGVGVARYVRFPDDSDAADAAVTVMDDYQGRGLGTALLEALVLVAHENGIRTFRTYVLVENEEILDLVRQAVPSLTLAAPGVWQLTADVPEQIPKLKETPLYKLLRSAARGEVPVQRLPRPRRRRAKRSRPNEPD